MGKKHKQVGKTQKRKNKLGKNGPLHPPADLKFGDIVCTADGVRVGEVLDLGGQLTAEQMSRLGW